MKFRRLIGRLFAVFVIAGLVAALVAPAAAMRLPVGEISDMATLSGGMPCCPDGQNNNGCRDCSLVAMCMMTMAQAESSSTIGIPVSFQTHGLYDALDDLFVDSLLGSPPDHPPRTSV
jgi:hypothetical protein